MIVASRFSLAGVTWRHCFVQSSNVNELLSSPLAIGSAFHLTVAVDSLSSALECVCKIRERGYLGSLDVVIQPAFGSDVLTSAVVIEGAQPEYPEEGCSVLNCSLGRLVRFGGAQLAPGPNSWGEAFSRLESSLKRRGMGWSEVLKTWSFLDTTVDGSGSAAAFSRFNQARSVCFDSITFAMTRALPDVMAYPANTGVSSLGDAPRLSALAFQPTNSLVLPQAVENPRQTPPGRYGPGTGRSVPAQFSRGVSLVDDQQSVLFLAGTAAVIGSKTAACGDVLEQCTITLDLIHELISAAPGDHLTGLVNLVYAIVYVARPEFGPQLFPLLQQRLGSTPFAIVWSPLTRDDLLVELDGLAVGGTLLSRESPIHGSAG